MPHSQSPPDVSVHSRETCFPCTALTFKPRIDSHHGGTWDSPVGKPLGKASWESFLGKPRGKATDPLIHEKGSATLLLQHESPAHIQRSPFPPRSPRCGILSLRSQERIPGVPVASQVEALSTGNARGTPESCHHSKSPLDVSVHSRGTCFPCTASTFTPRFDSHLGSMWDSPLG